MSFLQQITGKRPKAQQPGGLRPIARPNPAPSNRDLRRQVLYSLWRSVVALYARARLKMDIQWHAPPSGGPNIFAANHPTTTDPFYILTLLSEPVSMLVTAAAFEVAGFGPYLRAAGHVAAVRGSSGATVEAVARQI